MVLLRFYGFELCCQIFIFSLILCLSFGVIIWVLPTCLSILSFMLALRMLKLIITLFIIELLKKKLTFSSYPSRINLLMFLPNLFLMRPSIIFGTSFMWILLLQLEGAYYGMLLCIFIFILYLPYIGFWWCLVYYMVSIMYNPTHTHTHRIYIYIYKGSAAHNTLQPLEYILRLLLP